MRLVVDADALIKLQRAGVLDILVRFATLYVGREVWREAVEQGKAGGHPDAERIEKLADRLQLTEPLDIPPMPSASAAALGAGEIEAWQLLRPTASDALVSDDRAFLRCLDAEGVPYLTPAALIVTLVRRSTMPAEAAQRSLEALRPLIARAQYDAAVRALDDLVGSQGER